MGHSCQCSWVGLRELYILLVVLAEYCPRDVADDELECCSVHGRVYLVFGLVCYQGEEGLRGPGYDCQA